MRYQLFIAEVGTSLSIPLELLSFILFLVENCLDKWDHHSVLGYAQVGTLGQSHPNQLSVEFHGHFTTLATPTHQSLHEVQYGHPQPGRLFPKTGGTPTFLTVFSTMHP